MVDEVLCRRRKRMGGFKGDQKIFSDGTGEKEGGIQTEIKRRYWGCFDVNPRRKKGVQRDRKGRRGGAGRGLTAMGWAGNDVHLSLGN